MTSPGERVQTVCVDFDGVLHRYSKGWHDGTCYDEPIPGALDALRTLMETCAVVVHTSRRNTFEVAGWLYQRGFSCQFESGPSDDDPEFWNERGTLLVTTRKLPAVAYIDDRGIRFRNWDQALADLAAPDRVSLKVATVSVKMADVEPVKSFIAEVARVAILDTMTADETRTALETALRELGVTR